MDQEHADQGFFDERGFGLTIGFGRRPALLVIDLTRAFTDAQRPLGADLSREIEATNRLLDAAHSGGVPVFLTAVRYDHEDLSDAGIWALKQRGTGSLVASGDGALLDERLRRRDGDELLHKKYASCFFGTDLLSRLVCRGVDTLILAGTSTSGCVRATAVDACQFGLRPMVVREAVGDRSAAAHRQSLFDLHAKYADVVGIDSVLGYLEGLARTAPGATGAPSPGHADGGPA